MGAAEEAQGGKCHTLYASRSQEAADAPLHLFGEGLRALHGPEKDWIVHYNVRKSEANS